MRCLFLKANSFVTSVNNNNNNSNGSTTAAKSMTMSKTTNNNKRPQPPTNLPLLLNKSDFVFDSSSLSSLKSTSNGTLVKVETDSTIDSVSSSLLTTSVDQDTTTTTNSNSNSFDFDLIAQQLVTTAGGSQESKIKLLYIIDTFVSCRCYEWAFVLALVLQDFSVLTDVIRKLREPTQLSTDISKSIRKGLEQLDDWAQNEW